MEYNYNNENSSMTELDSIPDHVECEITKVSRLKGRGGKYRYEIFLGDYAIQVHEDTMIKFRMMKGNLFTKQELVEVIQADEKQQAYVQSLTYLSLKPRTRHEIASRLRDKGWEDSLIEQTTERLEKEGLIDDGGFAEAWVSQRIGNHGKGKLWIKQELRAKGVSKTLIEQALGHVTEDEEYESGMKLAQKRWERLSEHTEENKRKLAAFLMRRGYNFAVASRIIRNLQSIDEDIIEF